MKNKRISNIVSGILTAIAILLLVSSVVTVVAVEIKRHGNASGSEEILGKLNDVIGRTNACIVDSEDKRKIPHYALNGTDYCGVLYCFSSDREYPVIAPVSKDITISSGYVYSGSPYNGSLVIMGNATERCFDFADTVDENDAFLFTDMLGNQFSYEVISVKHISSPDEFADDGECDCALIIDKFADKYVLVKMKSAMTNQK